ncbi:MAG TPA: prolipoprotein diacylglyceryl transferase family protein, partial [Gemmatimonadota bacterium]|nr:prolipoprotein diacylglyceryl transferase family protein [Gemmatimonadota bacterium]
MYPELFRIGSHAVATYGVVVALAVLVGGTLLARGFEERRLEGDAAWSVVWWALVGAVVGAKAYYVLLHGDPAAIFSRSGLVWYGGLIGGLAAGVIGTRRMGLPPGRVADAAAPALALGHGLGHVGCFFSGDSYGLPSRLPWAVAFPRGAPPSTAGNLRHVFGVQVPAGVPDGQVLTVHP